MADDSDDEQQRYFRGLLEADETARYHFVPFKSKPPTLAAVKSKPHVTKNSDEDDNDDDVQIMKDGKTNQVKKQPRKKARPSIVIIDSDDDDDDEDNSSPPAIHRPHTLNVPAAPTTTTTTTTSTRKHPQSLKDVKDPNLLKIMARQEELQRALNATMANEEMEDDDDDDVKNVTLPPATHLAVTIPISSSDDDEDDEDGDGAGEVQGCKVKLRGLKGTKSKIVIVPWNLPMTKELETFRMELGLSTMKVKDPDGQLVSNWNKTPRDLNLQDDECLECEAG